MPADEIFSAEERAAMKEAVRERRAASRRGKPQSAKDGEREVLAKIAEMPEPDRAMAERIHAIVMAAAPDLVPRTWYGMPAYARDGNVVCFFHPPPSSRRAMRPWASATRRTSTRARCGRVPTRSWSSP